MGERDFSHRYRTSREYADEQAEKYNHGEQVDTYRGITGAPWVAEAYEIAAENARLVVGIQGTFWQPVLDECLRLAEQYKTKG